MPTIEQRVEALIDRTEQERPYLTDRTGREVFLWSPQGCYLPVTKSPQFTPTRTASMTDLLDGFGEDADFIWDHQPLIYDELAHRAASQQRFSQGVTGSGLYHGEAHSVFANGLVNLSTGELSPADPDFHVSGGFQTEYDPECPTPNYEKFMEGRGLGEDLESLETMVGWMFDSTMDYRKIMALVGDSYTGKSVFARLVCAAARGMVASDPRAGVFNVVDPRSGVHQSVVSYVASHDPSDLTRKRDLSKVLSETGPCLVMCEPNSWVTYGEEFDFGKWMSEVDRTEKVRSYVFSGQLPWQPEWFSGFEKRIEGELPGIVSRWISHLRN